MTSDWLGRGVRAADSHAATLATSATRIKPVTTERMTVGQDSGR